MNTTTESPTTAASSRPERRVRPRMDAWENADAYRVSVDLPGVGADDLTVEVEKDVLTITGRRRVADEAVVYSRSLHLPDEAANEKLEARLTDGVLTLHLPKHAKARVRSIPVLTG